MDSRRAATGIRHNVHPLTGSSGNYDLLLDRIGDARIVLLGEASHGTHEFYDARSHITHRLIREKQFNAIAVEADWPDAYRVNRFLHWMGRDTTGNAALGDFQRFPKWMWRNTDVLRLVDTLRVHNEGLPTAEQVGFYGMDLYSLHSSADAVVRYLERIDPEGAKRARYRYGCFDHHGEDPQAYGYAANFGLSESCEGEAVQQLLELQRRSAELANRDGFVAREEFFFAEQNARLVKDAEEYYRSMFRGRVSSWNLRDRHMVETMEALAVHLERETGRAKLVVWAHNSHLGDARATEMGEHGEWNVGQLARERWGSQVFSVGFTTYTGTVWAASEWGGEGNGKPVRPGLRGSYETLFHHVGEPSFLIFPGEQGIDIPARALERAIGVIYAPETERMSHYFHARLAEQFDAVIHFDETSAVRLLEGDAEPQPDEPETYPSGL